MYSRRSFTWTGLTLRYKVKVLAKLVKDKEFPLLYRIHDAEGISDIVNLTRAKEAAIYRSLRRLNDAETT